MPLERGTDNGMPVVMIPSLRVEGTRYWNPWLAIKMDTQFDFEWYWSTVAFRADPDSLDGHRNCYEEWSTVEWDPTIRF